MAKGQSKGGTAKARKRGKKVKSGTEDVVKNTEGTPGIVEGVIDTEVVDEVLETMLPVTGPPFVTPQKESASRMTPFEDDDRFFYIINKVSHEYIKQESKQAAMEFYETMRRLSPELAEKLVVQDFPSAQAMTTFIDALVTMSGGTKPASHPLVAAPSIVAVAAMARGVNPMAAASARLAIAPMDLVPVNEAKPAAKRPNLGFSGGKEAGTTMDDSMKRYKEALRNSNTKMDVWHLELSGSNFDVWGFSLKENDDYYWSWKPAVLEKAIMKEQEARLFEKEGITMDEMLGYVRAAHVREKPCGPNIVSSFTLKSGKKMDRMVLFGLIPSPSTEADVKSTLVQFVEQCKNPKIRFSYAMAMESTMKADNIKKDVQEGGPLWEKLISGCGNIVYRRLNCLSEVMCDHSIEEIIRLCFGYGGGLSPSMWDRRVYKLAFGEGDERQT